jgi:predicted nucleic acid-binding protein
MRCGGSDGRTGSVRLVVDTNLMIRAVLSAGPARQFFKLAPAVHQLVYHAEQFLELRDVAARPRLKIAPEAVNELVDRIELYGQRIDSDLNAPLECRDPKDDYVLGACACSKCTGHPHRG